MIFSFPTKRNLMAVFLAGLLFLLFPTSSTGHPVRVLEVFDGDTIRADFQGTEIRVRLAAIDAPEIGERSREPHQPYGEEAKGFLEGLILNRDVEIECFGFDEHDTYVGTVCLGQREINLEMVLAGFAEVYTERLPAGFELKPYYDAERNAMAIRAGMWSQGTRYVSPRLWRERERGKAGAALLLYGIFGAKVK